MNRGDCEFCGVSVIEKCQKNQQFWEWWVVTCSCWLIAARHQFWTLWNIACEQGVRKPYMFCERTWRSLMGPHQRTLRKEDKPTRFVIRDTQDDVSQTFWQNNCYSFKQSQVSFQPWISIKGGALRKIDKKMGLSINPDIFEFHREPSVESDPLEIFQHYGLSPRLIELLSLIAQGKTNKEIGIILNISLHTVSKHFEHIYTKLGVNSRTGAAIWYLEILHQAPKSQRREVYPEVGGMPFWPFS